MLLAQRVNDDGVSFKDQYVALANDIDMTGIEFIPIGKYGSGHYFEGTFDGNGFTISNLTIDIPNENNGLFGVLGGLVFNLKIEGGTIKGGCCGVISSHSTSDALIMNCLVRNVTVVAQRAGGIVDNFSGSLINCISDGCELNASNKVGRISSYAIRGDFYENYYTSEGTVTGAEEIKFSDCELNFKKKAAVKQLAKTLNTSCERTSISNANKHYGICNLWEVDDNGNIDISNTKQSELIFAEISKLKGTGSEQDPYLINSVEDLAIFRNAVNFGMNFDGQFLRQTSDLDLKNEPCIPIGIYDSNKYFYGTYDGAGHTISNIEIRRVDNTGFFGQLGGTVVNLGIESGTIEGSCCGAIASHAASEDARIVNCYNKASVIGYRAGGIADNFTGKIIGCWSDCELVANYTGGIASYSAQQISYCITSDSILVPESTMLGTIADSEAGADFSSLGVRSVARRFRKNIEKIQNLTGLSLTLSKDAFYLSFESWLKENLPLVNTFLVLIAIYLCIVFKIGPKRLYRDNDRWIKRFGVMLAPIFLFFYMFFIHSPIEFFLVNNSEFDFVFGDFAWKYIFFASLVSLVLSALMAFIKGKVCDFIVCGILGLDLAMYIQLNFLNSSLGLLDGTQQAAAKTPIVINLFIWAGLILLPFILFFLTKKHRRRIVVGLCALLCFMQITSICVSVLSSPESVFKRDNSQYLVNSSNQFTVSSNKNIIILMLDTYTNTVATEFMAANPDVAKSLKDFTYYNNADCHYEGSAYSLGYVMSGAEWDFSATIDEGYKAAWNSKRNNTFYSRLKEQGYIANFYTNELTVLPDEANQSAIGKVANLVETECDYKIDNKIMLDLFMNASLYRFAPLKFKYDLAFVAGDYKNAYRIINNSNDAVNDTIELDMKTNNAEFYQALLKNGLKTDDSSNYYILQHLEGVHPPYRINEKGEAVENATLQQTERGCWLYVQEYLNQLKKLGVYDDATIIITADHGLHNKIHDAQPIFFIKTPDETHEQYEVTSAPISFTDIMPTVMYLAGGKYSDLGNTIFDFSNGETRERTLYIRRTDMTLPNAPKRNSPTRSVLNCLYKYVYNGTLEDLRAIGQDTPTEKIQLAEAFY